MRSNHIVVFILLITAPVACIAAECSGPINEFSDVYAKIRKDISNHIPELYEKTRKAWATAKTENDCPKAIQCKELYEYLLLSDAVNAGDAASVAALLYGGVDPNGPGSEMINDCIGYEGGFSPLHDAVQKHDRTIVKVLLETGADPNAPNYWESYNASSPLHIAIETADVELVDLLLDYGAVPYVSKDQSHIINYNTKKYSALDWAKGLGNLKVIAALEKRRSVKNLSMHIPAPGSLERKHMLDAVREALNIPDQFIVSVLKGNGRNAFFVGELASSTQGDPMAVLTIGALLSKTPKDWKVISLWTSDSKQPLLDFQRRLEQRIPGGQFLDTKWPP